MEGFVEYAKISGYRLAGEVGGVIVGALIVTGVTFCYLRFCYKPKVRIAASEPHPDWVDCVSPDEISKHSFRDTSEGISVTEPNRLLRTRARNLQTDAARWSSPLKGHCYVFEVHWPKSDRGVKATVGVGTEEAPLMMEGNHSLVGYHTNTWGLDIVRKRALHGHKMLAVCPTAGFVPDTFLVYLDLQLGRMGFGTEEIFWGYVIKDLPLTQPLYFMVGMTHPDSTVHVHFKGKADEEMVKKKRKFSNATTVSIGSDDVTLSDKDPKDKDKKEQDNNRHITITVQPDPSNKDLSKSSAMSA